VTSVVFSWDFVYMYFYSPLIANLYPQIWTYLARYT